MATFTAASEPPPGTNDLRLGRAMSTPVPPGPPGQPHPAEASFVAPSSMQPFDVEEEPCDPPPARTNCLYLLMDALFPFRLLTDEGWRRRPLQRHPCCPSRRAIAGFRSMAPVAPTVTSMFAALLISVLLVVTMIVYLMLSISSMTPFMQMGKDHRFHNLALQPKVGNHWALAICGKHLLQTLLIHYLCWQVLEPDSHVAKERVHDPELLNKPEGIIHGIRRLVARILCQPYEDRWLSAFFVDHMLLAIVGLPYCLLQPMLSHMHFLLRQSGIEIQGAFQEDRLMFIAGIFSFYAGLNMVGFLCVTLGNGVRPRRGYAYVFQVATLVLAVCMALEFLVQQQYRQRYSQFQFKDVVDYLPELRLCMSASQLFATHGLFMLCAMHLGHAQHFQKCPDLPWRQAATKGLACMLLMCCVAGTGYINRTGHNWPKCSGPKFGFFAVYESIMQVSEVFVGLLLLGVGLRQSKERVELDAREWKLLPTMMAFIDFDSFLIFVTFSSCVGFRLAEVFNFFAQKMFISWLVSIVSNLSSLGLAVFAFACWRNPPLSGFPRLCLWLALLYAFQTFITFQFFEDCEFSSSMPGCCDFPSLRDVVGEGDEKWQRCALDMRCSKRGRLPEHGEKTFYCSLPEEDEDEEVTEHHSAEYTLSFRSTLSKEQCRLLHDRWHAYPKEFKAKEISEEEEAFSTAYRQLKAVGSAGTIEFHFATFGILLKVILFVEHPNSIKILQDRSCHEQTRLSVHAQ